MPVWVDMLIMMNQVQGSFMCVHIPSRSCAWHWRTHTGRDCKNCRTSNPLSHQWIYVVVKMHKCGAGGKCFKLRAPLLLCLRTHEGILLWSSHLDSCQSSKFPGIAHHPYPTVLVVCCLLSYWKGILVYSSVWGGVVCVGRTCVCHYVLLM